jgi:hypothetical protein
MQSLKALVKFPDLKKYEKAWPVTDLLQRQLNNSSTACRKKAIELNAAAVENLVCGMKLRARTGR